MSTSCPDCWSQLGGSWHGRLLRPEDDDHDGTDCEAGDLSKAPITLLICLCGLVGNGAVLWFLSSHLRRSPITIYVFSLAVANSTFLLSVAIALVTFYSPGSLCDTRSSRDVMTLLNINILLTFTAGVYLLAAFSAVTSLSVLLRAHYSCHHSCHHSWSFPVLICALLWVLSFLLTITLYFCPALLIVFVLSYFVSVLTLILSGLTLLSRILCCSWQYPPRMLCFVVLLIVFSFPFFTADFGYWLLLRLFDFSVFVFDPSLLLACVNSSISPLIYFLAGSFRKKFTLSVGAAFQRTFEDVTEQPNRGETPAENMVATAL
ncbi:PREDICTED: mas-related G-protein coupled receptor member B4-like [Chaetura pelagica]|uniref:mas-related G-protein coupled receptor member B4-like n=1 Tax=Chaetura pelagica TaxID=8897 RepID=UPI0005233DFE|nr:PREDICTED: mas-related G-protein coupled receptor member B4-like [Chaetura pelagica]